MEFNCLSRQINVEIVLGIIQFGGLLRVLCRLKEQLNLDRSLIKPGWNTFQTDRCKSDSLSHFRRTQCATIQLTKYSDKMITGRAQAFNRHGGLVCRNSCITKCSLLPLGWQANPKRNFRTLVQALGYTNLSAISKAIVAG